VLPHFALQRQATPEHATQGGPEAVSSTGLGAVRSKSSFLASLEIDGAAAARIKRLNHPLL
jgi:hypothetical protein